MRPLFLHVVNIQLIRKAKKTRKIGNWKIKSFCMDQDQVVLIVDKQTFPHYPHQILLIYLLRIIAIMLTRH